MRCQSETAAVLRTRIDFVSIWVVVSVIVASLYTVCGCHLQEHVINEWDETASEFHSILPIEYMKQIKELYAQYLKSLAFGK